MASGKHSPVNIDMTPMVDIAFLLLIFFMATTQFKEPESIAILLPESHSVIKLPESDVVILTVGPRPEAGCSGGWNPSPKFRSSYRRWRGHWWRRVFETQGCESPSRRTRTLSSA